MRVLGLAILGLCALLLNACGANLSTSSSSSVASSSIPETAVCTTVTSYSPSITINGSATFDFRQVNTNSGVLSGNPVNAPIAYAEVVVLNSAGAVVQCSTVDVAGNISLQLPKVSGSYVLQVKSRSNSSKLVASILKDPTSNLPYILQANFSTASTDTTVTAPALRASARQSEDSEIKGGAFNILKMLYFANEYLRQNTSAPSFVAAKISAYWKAGFNPASYFYGPSAGGLSFYRTGLHELYILGGTNGIVNNTDTDHFDNSVVLHEYGHFLEDVYGKSDSPGGSHNGNFIIDPRLAWSEGWANYFQANVIRSQIDATWKYYIDTSGFRLDTVESGSASNYFLVDFTMSGTTGQCYAGGPNSCDAVTLSGEGVFREMSISREMFKTTLSAASGGVGVPFANIWQVFSTNFHSNGVVFRNIASFNQYLSGVMAGGFAAAWQTVLTNEQQSQAPIHYANPLKREVSCTNAQLNPISLSPAADSYFANVGNYVSNLYLSNDFYDFNYTGGGGSLQLAYTNGSVNHDLDLILYTSGYVYFQEYQAGTTPTGLSAQDGRTWAIEQGNEQVNLAPLAPGHYLVAVKAKTLNKSNAQLAGNISYNIKYQPPTGPLETLCPTN